MRGWIRTLVVFASSLLLPGLISSVPAGETAPVPRRVLVKVPESGNPSAARIGTRAARRSEPGTISSPTGWVSLEVPAGQTPASFAGWLRLEAQFESVEVDRFARISPLMPNDLHHQQWSLENVGQSVNGSKGLFDADIDAPEAWELETGKSSVIVAVLDTGVVTTHADLAGNLLPGADFIEQDGDPDDDAGVGHGTPVAGIIGALGNNGLGISGINWSASILPVKVCDRSGYCPYSAIIAGINEAVRRGARVINLSVTCDEHADETTGRCGASRPGSCYSGALRDAISLAGRAGVLVVTSAGNCGEDLDDATRAYPCAYRLDNLICVGATDSRDEVAPFSNRGPRTVDIAAPGTQLVSLSTDPDRLLLWDGTSFAAPMVSGVAALQLARNSELTATAVRARLMQGEERSWLAEAVAGGMRLNAFQTLHDGFLSPQVLGVAGRDVRRFVGDFDGDGFIDGGAIRRDGSIVVERGTSSGFEAGSVWHVRRGRYTPFVGDINGDGRDDVVLDNRGRQETLISVGSRFVVIAPAFGTVRRRTTVLAGLADVDGDGRDDMILEDRAGVMVSLSTGKEFAPDRYWRAGGRGLSTYGDVDGDGLADRVVVSRRSILVGLSDGTRFMPTTTWGSTATDEILLTGDLDGDGLADLVTEVDGCWNVLLSDGNGFAAPRPWTCGGPGSFAALGRFDRDARADLIRVQSDQWTVSRSVP